MKKLFAAMFLLFLLVACGSNAQQGDAANSPSESESSISNQSLTDENNETSEYPDPMNYAVYFSEERPFESWETPLERGDLTRAADAVKRLLNEQQERKADKACRFGTLLYFYAAPDLFEYDLETDQAELLCSGPISTVSDLIPFDNVAAAYDEPLLFLSPDVAFYALGTEIYRYHIPSRTCEPVYQNDRLVSFSPLTNDAMTVTIPNPEWETAAAKTGNRDNGLPEYMTFRYHIKAQETEPYEIPFEGVE